MGEFSASLSLSPTSATPGRRSLRLGLETGGDAPGLVWRFRRNCSATPRQVLGFYGSICAVSALLAAGFWSVGASLVAPFAGLEMLAVGAALWIYARHATDQESIVLDPGRLTVERIDAGRLERFEFSAARVRVDSGRRGQRLVELAGEGRRIAVGRHLRPHQRRWLADELRASLGRSRFGSCSPVATDTPARSSTES